MHWTVEVLYGLYGNSECIVRNVQSERIGVTELWAKYHTATVLFCTVLRQAIRDMFGNADEPDEERLECMVKLMQTCGSKLDSTGSPDTVKVGRLRGLCDGKFRADEWGCRQIED